jgi:hypothetical protein
VARDGSDGELIEMFSVIAQQAEVEALAAETEAAEVFVAAPDFALRPIDSSPM